MSAMPSLTRAVSRFASAATACSKYFSAGSNFCWFIVATPRLFRRIAEAFADELAGRDGACAAESAMTAAAHRTRRAEDRRIEECTFRRSIPTSNSGTSRRAELSPARTGLWAECGGHAPAPEPLWWELRRESDRTWELGFGGWESISLDPGSGFRGLSGCVGVMVCPNYWCGRWSDLSGSEDYLSRKLMAQQHVKRLLKRQVRRSRNPGLHPAKLRHVMRPAHDGHPASWL